MYLSGVKLVVRSQQMS